MEKQKDTFDDEICSCEHSKGYHKAHQLDKHGGECEKCPCKIYIWKGFIKYVEWKPIKKGGLNSSQP